MSRTHPKPAALPVAKPARDPFITLAQIEVTIQRLRHRPCEALGTDVMFDRYEHPRTLLMKLYRDLIGERLGGTTLSAIPIEARGVLHPSSPTRDTVS